MSKHIYKQLSKLQTIAHLIFALCLLYLISPSAQAPNKGVSSLNMLLPICPSHHCSQVYAPLASTGSCYDWKNLSPHLIELSYDTSNTKCLRQINVSPKRNARKEDTAYIEATDLEAGKNVKIKVAFAEIHAIAIESQMNTAILNEIFDLRIAAKDADGNIFSSLMGFKFQWRIVSGKENAELIKPSEIDWKSLTPERKAVESLGKHVHSDNVLVKGMKIGKIFIHVDILEADLKDKVKSESLELYINEPFTIIPEKPIYILPRTKYQLNLQYKRSKVLISKEELKFFLWELSNASCGTVANGLFRSGEMVCEVTVSATDTRIDKYNSAQTKIFIVAPNSLDMGYVELDKNEAHLGSNELGNFNLNGNFKLVEGKSYLVKNFLMYKGEPVYYETDSLKFKFDFKNLNPFLAKPAEFKNSDQLAVIKVFIPNLDGVHIESRIELYKGRQPLVAKKTVLIYSKVKIRKFNMPFFSLPYLGERGKNLNAHHGQELYLLHTGGSGEYGYKSSNDKVVDTVNDLYVVSAGLGVANIVVYDKNVPSNFDNIDVHVMHVESFAFVEERQEIFVGNKFKVLPVALHRVSESAGYEMKYDQGQIFTNCTRLLLKHEKATKNITGKIRNDYLNSVANVRDFISKNKLLFRDRLHYINIEENTVNYEYFSYASFGLCNVENFQALSEGLEAITYYTEIKVSPISQLDPSISSEVNAASETRKILSTTLAQVYVYSALKISPLITDPFTLNLLKESSLKNPDVEKTYIIPEGNDLHLKFTSGLNPWNNFEGDFFLERFLDNDQDLEKLRGNYGFSMNTPPVGEKEVLITCKRKGFLYSMIFGWKNKKSPSLLRPGKSEIKIKLGCHDAENLGIYLLGQIRSHQDDKKLLGQIYKKPQTNGITYYVRQNSTDVVRLYGFLKDGNIIVNMTKSRGYWEDPSNNHYAYFESLKKDDYRKYDINPVHESTEDTFLQDAIFFKNVDKKFELRHLLKHCAVKHHALISVFSPPEITPNVTTIYVIDNNWLQLKIVKGSGSFVIKLNDYNLVEYNYNAKARTIEINPKMKGVLKITVIDTELQNQDVQHAATAMVYLAEVEKIKLYGSNLLLKGRQTVYNFEVFDNYGKQFTGEQLEKIPILFDIEEKYLFATLNHRNTNFTVKSAVVGQYKIRIKERHDVYSNEILLEVFDRLKIYPSYLLLLPGCSFTLDIKGGPMTRQQIEISYEILNKKVAGFPDRDKPMVVAKELGSTTIKVKMKLQDSFIYSSEGKIQNKSEEIISEETVKIDVAVPDELKITGLEDRSIVAESTIRLLSNLRKNGNSFTYGVCPVKYHWKSLNPSRARLKFFTKRKFSADLYKEDVTCKDGTCNLLSSVHSANNRDNNCLECQTSLSGVEEDEHPENSVGAFLYSYFEGDVMISLNLEVEYPPVYAKANLPKWFNATQALKVTKEKIFSNIDFYGGKHNKVTSIFLPFETVFDLRDTENRETKYALVRQGTTSNRPMKILNMTDYGRITTFFQEGFATVDTLDASIPISLTVFVTKVHSVFVEKTHTLVYMEKDQIMTLGVMLQHKMGHMFARKLKNFPLAAVASHPHICKVELRESNDILSIQSNNIGRTNVIIMDPNNNRIYDVFTISVVKQVTLLSQILVPVGGAVDLFGKDLQQKAENSLNFVWDSTNSQVVSVQKNTGYARTLKVGESDVVLKYKDTNMPKTSTRVRVRNIGKIEFDSYKKPKFLTELTYYNGNKMSYEIPIILYSTESEIFTNNESDKFSKIIPNVNVECSTEDKDFIEVGSNKENLSCLVKVRETPFRKKPHRPSEVSVVITITSADKQYKHVEKFKYIPKFKLNINGVNSTFIEFNSEEKEKVINVEDLNELIIQVESDKISIKRDDVNQRIRVSLSNEDEEFDTKLSIKSRITGQEEKISISYKEFANGGFELFSGFGRALTTIFVLVGTLALFVYALNLCLKRSNIEVGPVNYGNMVQGGYSGFNRFNPNMGNPAQSYNGSLPNISNNISSRAMHMNGLNGMNANNGGFGSGFGNHAMYSPNNPGMSNFHHF